MIEVISIDTAALGDRSYLATDGQAALMVDPQRDIGRVLRSPPRGEPGHQETDESDDPIPGTMA